MPRRLSNLSLHLRAMLRDYEARAGDDFETLYEARQQFDEDLQEAFRKGHLSYNDFSLREALVHLHPQGRDIYRQWNMANGAGYDVELYEAATATAVGYSDFPHITGQIFFSKIIENYKNPAFIFSAEIPTVQTAIQDLERIAGITQLGSTVRGIPEGQQYPRYGVGENYIDVAAKQKDGGIVEVTKEAMMGDLTGLLLKNCGKLGYTVGYGVEERGINAIIDQGASAVSAYQGGHQYTWRGTSYATYQSSTPWINITSSNGFVDETNLDSAWQTLIKIVDPFTNRPIMQAPKHLIVDIQYVFQAHRVINAVEIRRTNPGYATSGTPTQTVSDQALSKVIPGLKVMSSAILHAQMNSASELFTDWFLGDIGEAVNHFENWAITPEERGQGTDAQFERDIVLQYKASLKDAFAVIDPRYLEKNTA